MISMLYKKLLLIICIIFLFCFNSNNKILEVYLKNNQNFFTHYKQYFSLIWKMSLSNNMPCLDCLFPFHLLENKVIKLIKNSSLNILVLPYINRIFAEDNNNVINIFSYYKKQPLNFIYISSELAKKPLYYNGFLFIVLKSGYILKINSVSLKTQWKIKLDAPIIGSLVFNDDKLYLISKFSSVYAINAKNGIILWVKKRNFLRSFTLNTNSSPYISHIKIKSYNYFVLICPHPDGRIDFINLSSGNILETLYIGNKKKIFPDIVSNITFVNKCIIVASYNFGICAISRNQLQTRWNISIIGILKLFSDKDFIYAATSKEIICINANSGFILWKICFRHAELTHLISKNSILYFGCLNSGLFILDKYSGKILQNFTSKLNCYKNFFLYNNIFVVSNTGNLYCLNENIK